MSVDLRYLAETQPSLCIPRVFNNVDESRIRDVFDKLQLGKISRVDILARKNDRGETFKRVFIHFEQWFWNEEAKSARRALISGREIKVVYDTPWFWKVSANKSAPVPRREPANRPQIIHPIDVAPSLSLVAPSLVAPSLVAPSLSLVAPALSEVDEFGRRTLLNVEAKAFEPKKQEVKRPDTKRPDTKRPVLQKKKIEKPATVEKPIIEPREPRDEDLEPDVEYNVLPVPPKKQLKILKRKPDIVVVEEPTTQIVTEKDELYGDL